VQNVSWIDAQDFCHRLSKQDRRHYRLPTAVEWDTVCQASAAKPFNPATIHRGVWTAKNGGGHPHPVMQAQPNAWGVFDMLGNVAEWCDDGPPPILGTEFRFMRGGSLRSPSSDSPPDTTACSSLYFTSPTLGFRVVLAP
jgi:formylglycine-generating enzyme required for sulfatase activity